MNFVYLLPFSYFARTRLTHGSLAFHALFEWCAALLLVAMFGVISVWGAMLFAVGSYFAFISLYEIGYLFNDLVVSKNEAVPRLRGPQGVVLSWLAAWVLSRLFVFLAITVVLGMASQLEWWLFFGAMMSIFAIHNVLQNRESKVATFMWLAWFRFMAPVIFIVHPSQRMGIAMGAIGLYSTFRLFGYLDSKGLLVMPGRQSINFRTTFFLIPLSVILATWGYDEAEGFQCLTLYYVIIVMLAWVAKKLKSRNSSLR